MLKTVGSVLVLSGFAALWLGQLRSWRREITVLEDVIGVLERMESRIRLERTPLPRMLNDLGKSRGTVVSAWMAQLSAALRQGQPLPRAWADAAAGLPLEDEAGRAVGELGYKLSGDEMEICGGIAAVCGHLKKILEEKRRIRRDRERQAAAICFSGAALLIILLI